MFVLHWYNFCFDFLDNESNGILHQTSKCVNEVCFYKDDINFSSVNKKDI